MTPGTTPRHVSDTPRARPPRTSCSQASGVCQEKKSVHVCLSSEMSTGLLVGPASGLHTKLMTLLYLRPDLEGQRDPSSYTSLKTWSA